MLIPEGVRLQLPEYGTDEAAYGWLELLYTTGRSCRTALLSVQNRRLWGGLDATPSDPEYEALEHDLLRSSLELLKLALTPNDAVQLGEWQGQPPIYLPVITDAPSPTLDDLGLLKVGNKVIKKIRRKSNQWLIVKSFQELAWTQRIDDPIPRKPEDGVDPKRRLREAVSELNQGHETPGLIRFRSDGTGRGITWELLDS